MTSFTPPDSAWSDPFYERIAGSYALMAMNFTPENMLLLMYAPEGTPIYGGGMTNLTDIEHMEYSRSYLLNIVNNVVNRILLMDESRATWRDEVYVANILRKLGVTDIDFFLREARTVINDGRRTWRLLNLYRENEGLLREVVARERVREAAPTAAVEKDEARAMGAPGTASATLHSEIIRRFRTTEILSEMKAYATRTQDVRVSNAFDLSTAEFSEMLNVENLFEYRQRVLGGDVALVHRHTNIYEMADVLPAPAREGEAVGRAVCAAIINLAEHATLTRLSNMQTDVNVRVDLSRALPASTQITLERLKSHYAERAYAASTERLFESRLAELDAYETDVIRQFISETERFTPAERLLLTETERVDTRETEAGAMDVNVRVDPAQSLSASARIVLEQLKSHYAEHGYSESTERLFESRLAELDAHETEMIRQLVSETERFTPVERLLLAKTERVDTRATESETMEYRGFVRTFLEAQSEIRRERAHIERIIRQVAAPGGGEILRIFTEGASGAAPRTRPYGDILGMIETIAELIPSGADMSPGEMIYLREAAALREEEAVGGATPDAVAEGLTGAGGRDLKEALDAYDMRNKEAAQKLEERVNALRAETSVSGEDARRRSAREALKALNEPEKIINALLEGQEKGGVSRTQPPALTLLLEAASPEERTLYERVINYVQGAADASDDGVRPISSLAFNAEIAEIREREAVEMKHIEREYAEREEFVRDHIERVVDRERTVIFRKERARVGDLRRRSPAMVHRQQEQAGLSDEDRARVAAEIGGHTRSETTLQETILREQVSETEVNRAVREAEARSVSDISEMIDRALAVQMNAITGRVYNQVERRLTMERARRGK
jgi:hypothetical protein